jgi:hypothetical protein
MAGAIVLKTESAAIKTSSGLLISVVLTHSAACQISVKDGGSSGTEILGMRLGGAGTVVFAPCMPVAFSNLYVTLDAGTAPEISVVYV